MERGDWEDLAYVEGIKGEELLASPEEPRYILTVLKFEKLVTEEKIVTLAKFWNEVTRKSVVILTASVIIATIGTLLTWVTVANGTVTSQSRRRWDYVMYSVIVILS